MVSRRLVLTTAGASTLVIAGAGYWAWTPGGASAREPWRAAGQSLGDPRLDALAYAILAPNPHNMQPWQFELTGDNQIIVTCDLKRRLPETDPPDRQAVIGFGAMLELLSLAAAAKGRRADIDLFPGGEPQPRLDERPIAIVTLMRNGAPEPDPLFDEALTRRSVRVPFDMKRPVAATNLEPLIDAVINGSSAAGTVDPAHNARLIDLCKRAWEVEYLNDATRRESIAVMRLGNREVAANPDGLALSGAMIGLLKGAGLVSREKLDTPGAVAYERGLSDYMDAIDTAQGFVWLTSGTNTRRDQIAAGRDWVRLHLAAQQQGIAVHPLSQALQEFPAMAEHYAQAQREFSVTAPGAVQMLGRIGYAPFPAPSPRWPLQSRLVAADA